MLGSFKLKIENINYYNINMAHYKYKTPRQNHIVKIQNDNNNNTGLTTAFMTG